MNDIRSTDVPNYTRVTFDIDLDGLGESFLDDRTPTGLTRYAEKDITMEAGRLAGGNVIIPSVSFERVEPVVDAEPNVEGPRATQPEPKNLALELIPVEMEETIFQTLLGKGITGPVATAMTADIADALVRSSSRWLSEAVAQPVGLVAVAEELDLEAFCTRLQLRLRQRGFTDTQQVRIVALVEMLLTNGSTPTKRMPGQGPNRQQLTGFIAKHLEDQHLLTDRASQEAATSLVTAIEAAQLDGTLS